MKKLTSIFLCLVMAVVATVALTGCKKETKKSAEQSMIDDIGGCSETYTGTLSEEQYSSSDEAIAAVVANELNGSSTECTKTDAQKTTIPASEYAKNNIPAEYTDGATSVEKVEISYTRQEKNKADTNLTADGDAATQKKYKVTVYVINYENYWKYFSPVVENSQTLSKSYYESIFNGEKYKNCTMTSVMEQKITVSYSGGSESMTMKNESDIKYADNKIYIHQTTSMIGGRIRQVDEIEFYVEQTTDGYLCYMKDSSGSWVECEMSRTGFDNIEEAMPFANNEYLDHSYFTKTSYGCEIQKENFQSYLDQAMKGLAFTMEMNITDGSVKFYVSEGVLSGVLSNMKLRGSMSMPDGAGGSINAKYSDAFSMTVKCTNYGTTSVDRPQVG